MRLSMVLSSLLFLAQSAFGSPAVEGLPEETAGSPPPSHGSLRTGAVSFDVAFPTGGSFTGTNAIGARMFVSPTFAAGVYAQFSYDETNNLTAYGATLRAQSFLRLRSRANLYLFAQASGGQNKREGKADEALSETQAGAAAGLGVEIFLLPELSTSVDLGLGGTFQPSSRSTFSTGTSQIALHYFLGEE